MLFTDLPTEIIQSIINNLNIHDFSNLSRTCRSLNYYFSDVEFDSSFKNVIHNHESTVFQKLSHSKSPSTISSCSDNNNNNNKAVLELESWKQASQRFIRIHKNLNETSNISDPCLYTEPLENEWFEDGEYWNNNSPLILQKSIPNSKVDSKCNQFQSQKTKFVDQLPINTDNRVMLDRYQNNRSRYSHNNDIDSNNGSTLLIDLYEDVNNMIKMDNNINNGSITTECKILKSGENDILNLIPSSEKIQNITSANVLPLTTNINGNKENGYINGDGSGAGVIVTSNINRYNYLPINSKLHTLHSITSLFDKSKHWLFNNNPIIYDGNEHYSIMNDVVYILGEDVSKDAYIYAFKKTDINHNNTHENDSKLLWKTKFSTNGHKIWFDDITCSENFVLVTMSWIQVQVPTTGLNEDSNINTANVDINENEVAIEFQSDIDNEYTNEQHNNIIMVLSRTTGKIIGSYENENNFMDFKIIDSHIYCDKKDSNFDLWNNKSVKYELLMKSLSKFFKNDLDFKTYNNRFSTDFFSCDDHNNNNNEISIDGIKLKDVNKNTIDIDNDWKVVVSLNQTPEKCIKNNLLSQNGHYLSIFQTNLDWSITPQTTDLDGLLPEQFQIETKVQPKPEYLFLYNMETGDKRYYKIKTSLLSKKQFILIDEDLNVISLSDKYIDSIFEESLSKL